MDLFSQMQILPGLAWIYFHRWRDFSNFGLILAVARYVMLMSTMVTAGGEEGTNFCKFTENVLKSV